MIHRIEPHVGNGGQFAMVVAALATVTVVIAFIIDVVIGGGSTTPPPPASTVFAGSFGNNTASCPGGPAGAAASSCDIPVTLTHTGFHSVLRWDTTDQMTLALVDTAGKPVGVSASGSDGQAGVVLDVTSATPGSYKLRVTDVAAVGVITFSVGVG